MHIQMSSINIIHANIILTVGTEGTTYAEDAPPEIGKENRDCCAEHDGGSGWALRP